VALKLFKQAAVDGRRIWALSRDAQGVIHHGRGGALAVCPREKRWHNAQRCSVVGPLRAGHKTCRPSLRTRQVSGGSGWSRRRGDSGRRGESAGGDNSSRKHKSKSHCSSTCECGLPLRVAITVHPPLLVAFPVGRPCLATAGSASRRCDEERFTGDRLPAKSFTAPNCSICSRAFVHPLDQAKQGGVPPRAKMTPALESPRCRLRGARQGSSRAEPGQRFSADARSGGTRPACLLPLHERFPVPAHSVADKFRLYAKAERSDGRYCDVEVRHARGT
jgi:hypothetical protein